MRYCKNCGREVLAGEPCEFCGVINGNIDVPKSDTDEIDEERKFISELIGIVKAERIVWRICSFVMPVAALMMFFMGIIATGINMIEGAIIAELFIYAAIYFIDAIISAVMAARLGRFLDQSPYSDIRPLEDRAGSASRIVLAALSNNVALIFIIINFVRVRNNRRLLKRIKERQQN